MTIDLVIETLGNPYWLRGNNNEYYVFLYFERTNNKEVTEVSYNNNIEKFNLGQEGHILIRKVIALCIKKLSFM